MKSFTLAAGGLALSFVGLSALAGIVPVGPGDYVQSGLVADWDGICNVGAQSPHDFETTNWVNLVSGAPDAVLINTVLGTRGFWQRTGYRCNGGGFFQTMKTMDLGDTFTVELAVTFDNSEQLLKPEGATYSSMCPTLFGTSADVCNTYGSGRSTSYQLKADKAIGTTAAGSTPETKRPSCSFTESPGRYMNIFFDGPNCAAGLQETTDEPTLKTCAGPYAALGKRTWSWGGSSYNNTDPINAIQRNWVGTFHSVRIYNRVLTSAELSQNRIVDNVRIRGRVTATNLVCVLSGRPDVSATEDGLYWLSGSHTFTAGERTAADGTVYAPRGCFVETWNDAYGHFTGAIWHEGASITLSEADADLTSGRRITWEWQIVRGVRSTATYDAADYAQGALLAHWDGIRNAGWNRPHDPAAKSWTDLSPMENDGVFKGADLSTGCWTNGCAYRFNCTSYAQMTKSVTMANEFTVQQVLDYVGAEQTNKYPNTVAITSDYGVFMGTTKMNPQWKNDTWAGSAYRPNFSPWQGKYLTLAMDNDYSHLFEEAVWPTPGDSTKSRTRNAKAGTPIEAYKWSVASAADGWASSRYSFGTYYATRFYNRKISAEELAWNRKVDEARFRGIMQVTNVVVASDSPYAAGREGNGVQEVFGRWTFTAETQKTVVDGHRVKMVPTGYTLEAWTDGAWGDPVAHEGTSYTYDATASTTPVRLTWKWDMQGGLMLLVR